jgi:hypothetical protein
VSPPRFIIAGLHVAHANGIRVWSDQLGFAKTFCGVLLTGIVIEPPSLRARFVELQAQLEKRRGPAKAAQATSDETSETPSEDYDSDWDSDRDWDVPDTSRRSGQGRKKKSKKGKGKGKSKRKGRRRQGQTDREAGTAGKERSEEKEGEEVEEEEEEGAKDGSTLGDIPAVMVAEDRGEEKGEEAEECGICLLILDEGESLRSFSCGHLFHDGCLGAWSSFCAGLERDATCPLCRCPAL